MSRNFGIMSGRQRLGGTSASPSAYGATQTRADLNSSYRPLPQGSLHRQDIADAPLDVGAGSFVSLFLIVVAIVCVGLYFFLRAIGL